jgi:hypothetical protein
MKFTFEILLNYFIFIYFFIYASTLYFNFLPFMALFVIYTSMLKPESSKEQIKM